jgi:hypothetical protein
VTVALTFWLCQRLARRDRRLGVRIATRTVQAALVLATIASMPFAAIGIAAVGCAPDAYECPV